jgi:tetratricopeptide (TPR) repeat protein
MPRAAKFARPRPRPSPAPASTTNTPDIAQLIALRAVLETMKLDKKAEARLDEAQQLMYDAWEAPTPKKCIDLAVKAIGLSPLCADAFDTLARLVAEKGSQAQVELLRTAVAAGAAAIGKKGFEECAGHFWGFLETRPYMRARLSLATALWERNERDEAVAHLEEMLRLNPGDNQGLRYVLAGWLLTLGRLDALAALIAEYDEDSTAWLWTQALLAFRREGDSAQARKRLESAQKQNGHVAAYLLGERKLPRTMPAYISWGGEDEAIFYASDFSKGWAAAPGALDWLKRVSAGASPPPPPRRSARH